MGLLEGIVLDEFLRQSVGYYDRIGYNVPVWVKPPENRGILTGSKRSLGCPEPYRIDVVAGKGQECELIEVKETGNLTAVGQLLLYRVLFQTNFWGYNILHTRLVCLRAPEAIRILCRIHSINLSEVGESVTHLVDQVRMKKGRAVG